MSRWLCLFWMGMCLFFIDGITVVHADEPAVEPIGTVEFQPLAAATGRLLEALEFQGTPLPADDTVAIRQLIQTGSGREAVLAIQGRLDPHCLALVRINPESRVSVSPGPAPKQLIQQGWRTFLVKVHNEAGVNGELKIGSPQSGISYQQGKGVRDRKSTRLNSSHVVTSRMPSSA